MLILGDLRGADESIESIESGSSSKALPESRLGRLPLRVYLFVENTHTLVLMEMNASEWDELVLEFFHLPGDLSHAGASTRRICPAVHAQLPNIIVRGELSWQVGCDALM